jgi:protein ImuB
MFAVLYFPQFAMQAVLRHEPELWVRPVGLIDAALTVPRVVDATPSAREVGVADGMTAPHALARCRSVQLRHRSPHHEATATEAVLQAVYAFSPNLESTAPGIMTLDLRGLAKLSPVRSDLNAKNGTRNAEGKEGGRSDESTAVERYTAWAEPLVSVLETLGLRARVGIGPTPNVAQHAARWADCERTAVAGRTSTGGGSGIFVVTDSTAFVAALPPIALGPSSEVLDVLRRWGIQTVGELLALGQTELADRFGLEALALFAAASVNTIRPLRWVQPSEKFEESHAFETGIETLEPLLFMLRRFVDALSRRLEGLGMAAGSLSLRLSLESGAKVERVLRLPQPTHRPEVLFRMLHTHLETVRTESPVVSVALLAEPARPQQKQYSLFEAALRDPHQFQETLARLVALVGADRVGTPQREDTHRADAFHMVPPDFENSLPKAPEEVPLLLRWVPLRRFRPSIPAEAECDEVPLPKGTDQGRPVWLRCAQAQGRIRVAIGPWRASGRWWDDQCWARDEWDVVTHEGAVLRLVRAGNAWQVEGVLD